MMGNAVFGNPVIILSKSNYLIYQLLEESGLPPGILNFIPYNGAKFLDIMVEQPDLSALLFTGSSQALILSIKKLGKISRILIIILN